MSIRIDTSNAVPTPTPIQMGPETKNNSPLKIKFLMFVQQFDLTPIKYKLVKEQNWTLDRAELVEAQYKAFLFLLGNKEGRFFIPTLDIDEMWHTHILDTRKYMDDCATLFGEYIHHYPYFGMKDGEEEIKARKLFAETCETLLSDFDIKVKGLKFACCSSGSCSSGSSCSSGHCSSGNDSGGGHGGHGGHESNDYVPSTIISGCSTGSSDSPKKEKSRRTTYTPPSRPEQPQERKRGIFRRILGLSPAAEKWYSSVTPEFFNKNEFRPDQKALQDLARTSHTRH